MKVLAVYDTEGWAWYHMARAIALASPQHEWTLIFHGQYTGAKMLDDYDRALVFSWPFAADLRCPGKVCAVVASHTLLGIRSDNWQRLSEFNAVACTSRRLWDEVVSHAPRALYCPPGVDAGMFYPRKTDEDEGLMLRVGWCGSVGVHGGDHKGYETVWRAMTDDPEVSDRYVFTECTSTAVNALPHEQMADWFRGLDVFCCTSKSEGGPLTVLEALASGVPVASTDVGIVPDVVRHGINGCIVRRNAADFKRALAVLDNDRDMLNAMREHTRDSVVNGWTWAQTAPAWERAVCGE